MEEKKRAIKSVSIDLPDKNQKVLSPPRQQIREFRSCADGEMTSLQRLQKFQEGGREGVRERGLLCNGQKIHLARVWSGNNTP